MNSKVNVYIGKLLRWQEELEKLREIILSTYAGQTKRILPFFCGTQTNKNQGIKG